MSDYEFVGYNELKFTMVPDEFFDWQMQDMGMSELKVLLYIFRRTFGFKKHQDHIALGQFADGICKRSGEKLDNGSGVSKGAISGAIKSLTERGLIGCQFYCRCGRMVEQCEMEQEIRQPKERKAYSVSVVPKDCPGCGQWLRGREERWFSLVMGSVHQKKKGGISQNDIPYSAGENTRYSNQDTVTKIQKEDSATDAQPPDFFPKLFSLSISKIKKHKFTKSQWETIIEAEQSRTDKCPRSTLIKWVEGKLAANGSGATYDLALLLADVCQVDFEHNKGELLREAKILKKPTATAPPPTPERVKAALAQWYILDWRGKRGDPPSPTAFRKAWRRLTTGGNNGISSTSSSTPQSKHRGKAPAGTNGETRARIVSEPTEEQLANDRTLIEAKARSKRERA